ncbi:MAG: TIGR02206 family membrane protein [Clostridia bacterium]|nr:TIGR02206 family membrane protein [Clostridia bacterium]
MFSTAHFIWLGCIFAAIAIGYIVAKKLRPSHDRVHLIVTCLLIITHIIYMAVSMREVDSEFGGFVLKQENLPFHLCSIMIYFTVFLRFIKNEKIVAKIKSFMVPAMFIGAAMALLIPTSGTDPTDIRVWEYMVAHGVLVFYGLYLVAIEKVDLGLKAYFSNLQLLLATAIFAFMMNSILVDGNANFFFLRKPPMDGLPILNLDHGWFVYIISLSIVACVLILLIQLPFIIKEQKAKKMDK